METHRNIKTVIRSIKNAALYERTCSKLGLYQQLLNFVSIFLITLFIIVFYLQLTLRQLIQLDLKFHFIIRSQSGRSIQSDFSSNSLFQVVIQSIPPIEGLLPPTDIEQNSLPKSASKVAGLQVHGTTPGKGTLCNTNYMLKMHSILFELIN